MSHFASWLSVRSGRLLISALTFVLTCGLLGISPAQAAPTPKPAVASGKWLSRQLTDGIVVNNVYSAPDYGLTLDVGLAQAALGNATVVRQIRAAVRPRVDSYTTGFDWGAGDIYAGPTAKLATFVQVANGDPRAFGKVNLIKRLAKRVSATAPIKGRLRDKSAYGDYANTIGQSYAARALHQAGHRKAKSATNFLLKQQCPGGFFRLDFTPDVTSSAQGCNPDDRAGSAPDTDATALAVINLSAIDRPSAKVSRSIKRATRWLMRKQALDGSFGGGVNTEAANANSTGVSGWALGIVGRCTAARDAARWLRALQVRGTTEPFIVGARGAVAYDAAGLAAAQAAGSLAVEVQDQWRRATAQAAPALMNLRVRACEAR